MTAIVGILCQQGVIIGTDSSATFVAGQVRTIEQPTQKLSIIGDSIIIAGSGQVGLGQRFQAIVEKAWNDGIFQKSALEVGKHLSRTAIDDFAYTYSKQGQFTALVAFPAENKAQLCEFALQDFQPELKTEQLWYCSMGSTQTITDSFLALMRELFWQGGPPAIGDGLFAVTWALEHAIEVNPGGVNRPIRIAVLGPSNDRQLKVELLSDAVLGEHRQNIQGAKNALRKYCENLSSYTVKETPDIPHPS